MDFDSNNVVPVAPAQEPTPIVAHTTKNSRFSDGFYPLQFNDGLATATNLATDLPTDNIPSPK